LLFPIAIECLSDSCCTITIGSNTDCKCAHKLCSCVLQFFAQFSGGASLQPVLKDVTEKYSCDKMHPIATRALELLAALPDHSSFRAVLTASLLRDFDVPSAAQLACCSETAARDAFERFPEGDIGEIARSYGVGVERVRIPELRVDVIKEFIKELCPGSSGQTREHYYQRITREQLYADYRAHDYEMQMQMLASLKQAGGLVDRLAAPALASLVDKLELHQQRLAFLSFLHTDPDSSRAFAGVHLPGPAQIALDYYLDQLAVPAKHVSEGTFDRIKRELPLTALHDYWGQFACATCAKGRGALQTISRLHALGVLSKEQSAELETAQKTADKYAWHLRVLEAQTTAVKSAQQPTSSDSAVVLADFGTWRTEHNVADKDKGSLAVLCLVLMEIGGKRTYIDVLCRNRAAQKGDWYFWRAALLTLLADPMFARFKQLTFITDNAAKPFRSRLAFALDADLQRQFNILIMRLYRAERHGHSLCDSHFGLGAKVITRHLLAAEHARLQKPGDASQLLSPLSSADELAKLLTEHFSGSDHPHGYRCVVLDDIARDPRLKPDVRRVPGTMRLHEIHYTSPSVLQVKELSSDPEPHIVNLHFGQPWSVIASGSLLFVSFLP
jgi:hypothetical protein